MRASPSPLVVILLVIVALLAALAILHASVARHEASKKIQEAATTTSPEKIPRGTYLVEIGDPRCPHCQAMKEFFKSYSGESGVEAYFCSVLDKVCADAFWRLYKLGATEGVPTIIACRGNRIGFIEVGELENSGWWSQHLSTMTPIEAGKVQVYVAGQPYKKIEVDRETVLELCNTTLAYSKPIG